jgi:hypothetical protein
MRRSPKYGLVVEMREVGSEFWEKIGKEKG